MEEAEAAFDAALDLNTYHPRATFNLGLLRWRDCRGTDIEILAQLTPIRNLRADDWEPAYLIGLVQLERLDVEIALKNLEADQRLGGGLEVRAALEQARRIPSAGARRLPTFVGHTDCVNSVVFSPDGRLCLSGSADKMLRLWDASTGQCLRTFKPYGTKVRSVAFSPSGRFCLSGSDDNTLRLWNVLTSRCVRTFEGHTEPVNSVACSLDGRFCLSAGSGDKTLRLWDASTGWCVRTFEGHAAGVSSVAFSPDGRFCLSGSGNDTLRRWEFDWEYEFPGWADWDTGAQPHLEIFLTLHGPHGDDGSPCTGEPTWTEEDFQTLLINLQYRGYGWLRAEGVRKKLEEMSANWRGPPPLPGESSAAPSPPELSQTPPAKRAARKVIRVRTVPSAAKSPKTPPKPTRPLEAKAADAELPPSSSSPKFSKFVDRRGPPVARARSEEALAFVPELGRIRRDVLNVLIIEAARSACICPF